jgi:hypothetical protein
MATPATKKSPSVQTLNCSICKAVVTAETYAGHIAEKHSADTPRPMSPSVQQKSGTFVGRTQDAGGPILSAKFWREGVSIKGVVLNSFRTENGDCYVIDLDEPSEFDRRLTHPPLEKVETLKKVSVGALKGFGMALQSCGIPSAKLLPGDAVTITCTGTSPTRKGNDQINFEVIVAREKF